MNNLYPTAIECPVELILNDNIIANFLCSPYDLNELAIGHMLTRGMIKDISDIDKIDINSSTKQIFVYSKNANLDEKYNVSKFIISGKSSVDKFNDEIYKIPKNDSSVKFSINDIVKLSKIMTEEAPIYNKTGGVHGAIIMDINNKYFLKEDIGRHSAVDKAIGKASLECLDFKNSFISTTGRISLDMLLKSSVCKIPIIVSLKRPSDLAVKLANRFNITIVAKSLSENPLVYTNPQRIIL